LAEKHWYLNTSDCKNGSLKSTPRQIECNYSDGAWHENNYFLATLFKLKCFVLGARDFHLDLDSNVDLFFDRHACENKQSQWQRQIDKRRDRQRPLKDYKEAGCSLRGWMSDGQTNCCSCPMKHGIEHKWKSHRGWLSLFLLFSVSSSLGFLCLPDSCQYRIRNS